MSITDVKVRTAPLKAKPYKLFDGGGLFLLVQPSGSKCWRYKYRFAGKEKLLALGAYPDVGLAAAREYAACWIQISLMLIRRQLSGVILCSSMGLGMRNSLICFGTVTG